MRLLIKNEYKIKNDFIKPKHAILTFDLVLHYLILILLTLISYALTTP